MRNKLNWIKLPQECVQQDVLDLLKGISGGRRCLFAAR